MNETIVAEYVELCEQLAAVAALDEDAEQRLSDRLDELWYAKMTTEDRYAAEGRLVARARSAHDKLRMEAP